MCRALISTGHDPATRLEAFRGDTLPDRPLDRGRRASGNRRTRGRL
jgi:hypothetical protein